MKASKVVVTLLILVIVLSVVTIAFSAISLNKTAQLGEHNAGSTATVSLVIEGENTSDGGNVGLYIEGDG